MNVISIEWRFINPVFKILILGLFLNSQLLASQYLDQKTATHYLLIRGNDCVNCYASINLVVDHLEKQGITPVIVVKDIPKRSINEFLEYKLQLQSGKYQVLNSDSIFDLYTDMGLSTYAIIENNNIRFKKSFKSISIDNLKTLFTDTPNSIAFIDSIDVSAYVSSAQDKIYAYSSNDIIIYNSTRGCLYKINFNTNKAQKILCKSNIEPLIDAFLSLSELTDEDRLTNNTKAEAKNSAFNLFPSRLLIRGFHPTNTYNYIPIEILSYQFEYKTNDTAKTDTLYQLKWFSFFAVYDKNWRLINKISFPYQLEMGSSLFNHLLYGNFVDEKLYYMNISSMNNDSLIVSYSLSGKKPKVLNKFDVKYPDNYPKQNAQGIDMKYPCSPIDKHFYTFRREPYLYSYTGEKKIMLDGWKMQLSDDNLNTNLWLHDFENMKNGNKMVLGCEYGAKAKMKLNIYDGSYSNLLNSIELANIPWDQSLIHGNTIIGLRNTDDKASLYVYRLVNQ